MIQKSVSAARELSDKVKEINGLESGEVRIGIFSSLSQHVLPGLIKSFGDLYPGINFVLYQGDNKTFPTWVKNGIIDFAFMYPEVSSGFKTATIATEQFLAVLPQNHPLAERKTIPLNALAKEPLIIVEEGGHINTALNAFSAQEISPNVKFRIQDDATILAMVEKGLGVSLLSAMTLEHSTYQFQKLPTSPPVERTICVAYENPALLPIATKRFLNFMYEHLHEYMNGDYVHTLPVQPLK